MKGFVLASIVLLLFFGSVAFGQVTFYAEMDSAQEVPASSGAINATGTGAFSLNASGTQLVYRITVNGVTGPLTAGHFHAGALGVAGPVVKTLNFVNNTATGVWSSTDATQPLVDSLVRKLLGGQLYINVHTAENPGGEIRGQVSLTSSIAFTAMLDSIQEIPAPAGLVPGKGTFAITLYKDGHVEYNGTFTGLSGSPTAAHFHTGAPGVAGGVVKTISITKGNTGSGTWASTDATQPLTDALFLDLYRGQLYVNVHTTANPGGEIRGQVTLNDGSSASVMMDSAQEVPAPSGLVPGVGTGSVWLNSSASAIGYSVTVDGLSGPLNAGHFHNGALGAAGGVVKTLSFVNGTANGTWSRTDASQPLTDSMITEFLDGRLYINVHTTANPGGEIRGQVHPSTSRGFYAAMDSADEVPSPVGPVPGTGTATIEIDSNGVIEYLATVTNLSGPLSAGHFHLGAAGVAGGVVKPLAFTNNSTSGTWSPTDATQPLTDVLLRDLMNGQIYINVHTSANPGGEIRGQFNAAGQAATGVAELESDQRPASFQLDQNYPNPFNPTTTISFALQSSARVSLKIYNVLGQQVAVLLDDVKPAGAYRVTFDASTLASGVYFYRLSTNRGLSIAKKMVLMK
jgi:CHRD domain/Secretion system C-terminal sorting domain